MKRITYNKLTKRFSTDESNDGFPKEVKYDHSVAIVDDGKHEPSDYLNGIPATVLDLKDPIAKYDEDELNKIVNGSQIWDKSKLKDSYENAISNYNKESAINRHLNELGSTDYDLSGEKERQLIPLNGFPNESSGHLLSLPNWAHWIYPEYVNIGLKDYFQNTGDTISHELGHNNDPHGHSFWDLVKGRDFRKTLNNKESISDVYGSGIAEAWDSMKSDGIPRGSYEHDHTPWEIYADAAALRSNLFKSGLWNGKDPITEDMVTDYINSENEFRDAMYKSMNLNVTPGIYKSNSDFTTAKRLDHYFTPDQITKLLNSSRKFSIKFDESTKRFSLKLTD